MPPKGSKLPIRKKSLRQADQRIAASAANKGPSAEQISRRKKRQIDELERSNYTEPKLTLTGQEVDDEDKPGGSGGTAKDRSRSTISDKKRKSSIAVRRVLLYRKNLTSILDEFSSSPASDTKPNYLSAATDPPATPRRAFCSVCGYWGTYTCQKCGLAYCTLKCQVTHDETRCERRVI